MFPIKFFVRKEFIKLKSKKFIEYDALSTLSFSFPSPTSNSICKRKIFQSRFSVKYVKGKRVHERWH